MFVVVLAVAALACVPWPAAEASPFGICAHIPDQAVLDRIEEAGIGWIRIDMLWTLVQPERNLWDWSVYDRVVDDARARGLEIYATLSSTPAWATDGPAVNGPPRDPGDWARFCYRAARRYSGRIAAWGMWNEPNLDRFWTGGRTRYIEEIVIPGADAIHAAAPFATVCAPDTAHLHSARWDRWLAEVIERAGDRIDVVTHHVYPPGASHRPVSSALDRPPANPWDDPSVRQVLEDAGWFGRPFWLTETGLASDVHGKADQAGFYTNLLDDWFRPGTDLDWIGRIFFYEAADDPAASHAWGVLGPPPAYEPKPAYFAYQDFIANAEVPDSGLVSAAGPLFLHPGETRSAVVTFANTGSVPWTAADGYRLEAIRDPAGLVSEDLPLDPGVTIPPGEHATFRLTLAAVPGEDPGPETLVLRMAGPGDRRFGTALRAGITVSAGDPPVVRCQPFPRTVPPGVPAILAVEVEDPTGVSYRWQRDGADVRDGQEYAGTASSTLTILAAGPGTEGEYRCLLTNAAGTVATVTVSVTAESPRGAPRYPAGREAGTMTHREGGRHGCSHHDRADRASRARAVRAGDPPGPEPRLRPEP